MNDIPDSTRFTLHWSAVAGTQAQFFVPAGYQLLAIWPSPVNPDACFEAAGFTDFGDQDVAWDKQADTLRERLLVALRHYGAPRLLSVPLHPKKPWWSWSTPEPLSLPEQVSLPQYWDNLPECVLAFGESGVQLRTGQGHHLYWLTLPDTLDLPAFAVQLAEAHPCRKTPLRWCALRGRSTGE